MHYFLFKTTDTISAIVDIRSLEKKNAVGNLYDYIMQ